MSPWRAKREGDTSEIDNIFVEVEGATLWREKNFRKKSHNAEKLKGETLWGFSTSILSQNFKKTEGGKFFLFSKKNHTMPKKTEKGTLWDFSTSILSQNSNKIEGGPFVETFSEKKSRSAKKN